MHFRITGLSPEPFRPLFGLSEADLAARSIKRVSVPRVPGYPDRIELRDAGAGESVLLLNYEHEPAATPYRASHAIFVREGAEAAFDATDEVPPSLRSRVISLRGFGADHCIVDADLSDGAELASAIERFFANDRVAYLHAHYAKHGCYAARIDRA
jgi:hypothetical protein